MSSTTPEFFPVSEDLYRDSEEAFYGHHERLEKQLAHSRFVIVVLVTVCLTTLATTTYLAAKAGTKPVHVVRVNDVGRADALAYFDDSYRPQAPEVRYFLSHWARQRYTRNQQTTQIDYPQSYYFLESSLANRLMNQDQLDNSSGSIRQFYAGAAEEVSVTVANVVVKRLTQLPYQADIYINRAYLSNGTVARKDSLIIPVSFSLNPSQVKNNIVPFNPLGLTISAFTEYQDFSNK
jgi:type IV secretory pathway component VirB8